VGRKVIVRKPSHDSPHLEISLFEYIDVVQGVDKRR
jgi:hypothetical protein